MSILKVSNTIREMWAAAGPWTESVASGDFDAVYTDRALAVAGDTNQAAVKSSHIALKADSPASELWFHARISPTQASVNNSHTEQYIAFFDANANLLAQARKFSGTSTNPVLFIPAAGSPNSDSFVVPNSTPYDLDVRYSRTGNVVIFEVYFNGTLAMALSATTTASLGLPVEVRLRPLSAGYPAVNDVGRSAVSELILSTTSTIGQRLAKLNVAAAGDLSQMSGNPLDLNTDDIYTGITAVAADRRSTFIHSAYGGAARPIAAVIGNMRASHTGGPPTKMAQSLRIGGANYDGADVTIDIATKGTQIWGLNPATGLIWDSADLAGVQLGLKSGA